MEEERWPKTVLREEMRGTLNKNPSKWGKSVQAALEQMGCDVVNMIYQREEIDKIEQRIDEEIERYRKKLRDKDKKAIEESSYNNI